jgi:hypothetical protein
MYGEFSAEATFLARSISDAPARDDVVTASPRVMIIAD